MHALILSVLLGCAPKAGVVQAPSPMDVAFVGSLEPLDEPQVQPLPDLVRERLEQQARARNLSLVPVDASAWEEAFTKGRTTRYRVDHVAAGTQAPLVLVVETFARYGSQLNGRYRWTVQVTASVAPSDDVEQLVSSDFNVPVFLQYHHEGEAEAVQAAAPVIERQVGYLLDQVLGGLAAR